ncbi:hypothetical protein ADIS_3566 [Lunatimonas lonarensis]|uniref:Uncharacterized protein n=1 Tax=Lunatimonas lonarensis TaxID=1232681 RepID=R7ZPJ1_9BACT|nr:hypothetical protein [Lunatimonas lonarensis]EON75978.1 hypothetical protein ADIS_3566 [Lunatimonas lonarensis]
MELSEFKISIAEKKVPEGISVHLRALWLDASGDWQRAHDLIDQRTDRSSAALHAYLHRKEGDQWNADYWYSRAGKKRFQGTLEEEWEELTAYFLGK